MGSGDASYHQQSLLLLVARSLSLLSGEAAVITGEEFEGKGSLLALVLGRMMPFKGHIAYQLPDSAIPDASHLLPGHSPPGSANLPGMLPGKDTAGEAIVVGGPGWKWATLSFRHDNVQLVRSRVGFVSSGCCGIFRTTVEDNIAVATSREVTSAEVREVCRKVGAHEALLRLPDGCVFPFVALRPHATLLGQS